MGDSVKITVIATGFQRDSLPEFERRSPHFPFNAVNTPENGASSDNGHSGPHQIEISMPEPVIKQPEPEPAMASAEEEKEDVEVPAILRKRRAAVTT